MSKSKRITPDTVLQAPDETTVTEAGPKAPVKDNTLLETVERQSKQIDALLEQLNAQNSNKTAQTLSAQQERVMIEHSSKTQKQLLVERLNKQDRVAIMIPLGINERHGATQEVGINGVVFVYPKGQMLEVPRTVFELLKNSLDITVAAGSDIQATRSEDIADALKVI